MDKNYLPDFSEKCISMRIEGSEYSHDLFNPRFEYQGGVFLLVGTIPLGATDSDWNANEIGAVNWSRVISYTLFEDIESYTKAIKIADEGNKKEET